MSKSATTSSDAATFKAAAKRIVSRSRRSPDLRGLGGRISYRLTGTPERAQRTKKRLLIGGPPLLAALGVGAWLILRPIPQPDYQKGRLDKVFNYTLLTDEFNRLSVDERMALIMQLVARLQDVSAGDSVLMASFAAGVAGAARKQIEENASRLAIDLWDKYALDYVEVPPEKQGEFLDSAYVQFVRTMEALDGKPTKKTDQELLDEARTQTQRDLERAREGKGIPPTPVMGRMFTFMRHNVGGHATPSQRTRGQQLMLDMVRHFRR